jgi:hypothetical protein
VRCREGTDRPSRVTAPAPRRGRAHPARGRRERFRATRPPNLLRASAPSRGDERASAPAQSFRVKHTRRDLRAARGGSGQERRRLAAAERKHVPAVRPRGQRSTRPRENRAAARKVEFPEKRRRNFRDIVHERRSAEARMEFAGQESAARALAALDHSHAQARLAEDRRRSQAFRARADDRRVVAQLRTLALPHQYGPRATGLRLMTAEARLSPKDNGQRKGRKRPVRTISALG